MVCAGSHLIFLFFLIMLAFCFLYLAALVAEQGAARCQHLLAVQQQLRWFASRQIRNVACLAGNIVTASPISDLNPVLQAAGARLELALLAPKMIKRMSSRQLLQKQLQQNQQSSPLSTVAEESNGSEYKLFESVTAANPATVEDDDDDENEAEVLAATASATNEHEILVEDTGEARAAVKKRNVNARNFFIGYRKVDLQPVRSFELEFFCRL